MTDAINDAVAMAIAVTKATLVILFFMGVWHSARINKVVVWSSFFFLLVLFAFSLADYFSRGLARGAGEVDRPASPRTTEAPAMPGPLCVRR